MPRIMRLTGLFLLGLVTGCGGGPPSTSDPGTPPPHQGNLVRILGGKGLVEIVQKKAVSATEPMTGEVSFYFLKDDGQTPIAPAPAAGTLEVGQKKVALKPQGDALVTPSGPPLFAKTDGVDGVLKVELDGQSLAIPLGVR
jgi:hypothetical protein